MHKKNKSVRIVYVHVRRIFSKLDQYLERLSHVFYSWGFNYEPHARKAERFSKIVQLRTESYSILMLNLANIS